MTLLQLLQLILCLSILVIFHEGGHFLPARWFNTRVEKFYLFFDPYFSIFKKKIGETEYGIGWIPFGGYVKIAGMIDESFDSKQLETEPQEWEFRSKKPWQRLIIMLGGVTVNFILGILIFGAIALYWGEEYLLNKDVTSGIAVDSIGYDIGLRDGDKIIAFDGIAQDEFNPGAMTKAIVIENIKTVSVERNGAITDIDINPKWIAELSKYENRKAQIYSILIPNIVYKTAPGSAAKNMGLKSGDNIIEINQEPTLHFVSLKKTVQKLSAKDTANVTIIRANDTIHLSGVMTQDNILGVEFNQQLDNYFTIQTRTFNPLSAMIKGWNDAWNFLGVQLKAFGQMFTGKLKAKDSLGSIITMGSSFDENFDFRHFWRLTAMLSMILGFMNLLPIPGLDGGYVMFLFYEMILGRKPSDQFMVYANTVGFAILICLMVYSLGLDIFRLL